MKGKDWARPCQAVSGRVFGGVCRPSLGTSSGGRSASFFPVLGAGSGFHQDQIGPGMLTLSMTRFWLPLLGSYS
jgi:hypothetical protein